MVTTAELASKVDSRDPAVGLPAVAALRALIDDLEALHVTHARTKGWTWDAIATHLGVTRQSVHRKYARKDQRK